MEILSRLASFTRRLGRAAPALIALAGCARGSPAAEGSTTGSTTTSDGGGSGGSAPVICSPLAMQPCYTGPPGTEGVGLCVGGTSTCNGYGTAWGPCVDEVTPVHETCATPGDDDCNGKANEGGADCVCVPGSIQPCYSGPPSTEGLGICHGGTQVCNADGLGYGPCEGEVTPQPETCDTPYDDNCNGVVNEGGTDCVCLPSATASCYTGPPGTEGVGVCHHGTHTCNDQGTAWGPCEGEVTPSQELCSTPVDDDCNGLVNEGGPDCVCTPGATAPCYDGPAGTEGVGICHAGVKDCNGLGTAWGPCLGEVTPQPETCNTPVDDNCNGQINEGGAGCLCSPGSTAPCYTGPAGTEGVGVCHGGSKTCDVLGKTYGLCLGEVTPQPETCNTPVDDNCNGQINEGGAGCLCSPGSTAPCYTGPAGTEGVGVCHGGSKTCQPLGTAYGPCLGEATPSAEDCATAADENCDGVGTCAGRCQWTKQIVTGGAFASAYAVGADAAGDVFVAGDTAGVTLDLGGGPGAGPFLLALGPSGAYRWSRFFSNAAALPPHVVMASLATNSAGDIVFAGTFTGAIDFGGGPIESSNNGLGDDAFVVEFDAAGNPLWTRVFGALGVGVVLRAVTVDAADEIVAAGAFAGASIDFGDGPLDNNGSDDIFVVKLDPSGDTLWSRSFGGGGDESALQVATGPTGEVVVAGVFEGSETLDFGLGPLVGAGSSDVFLAKLDAAGSAVWAKRYGDALDQWVQGLAVDPSGAIVLGGNFVGSIDLGGGPLTSVGNLADDVYLARLDPSGNHLWSKRFGDAGHDGIVALAVDGAGNVVLTGIHDGVIDLGGGPLPSYGGDDVYLGKLDPSGNHLWSGDHGDAKAQLATGVSVDHSGDVITLGTFQSSIDFGCGPVTEASYYTDFYVAKLGP